MPLIQGGPPEWIWERTADPLRWSVTPSERENETVYEVRVECGMGIMRLQFFTAEEAGGSALACDRRAAPGKFLERRAEDAGTRAFFRSVTSA